MLTGENGIVTQAQEAKENNERGRVIEDVKLAYNKVTIDKLGVQDISTMRDLTIIELKKQGYDIKDITTTTETITEINLSTETLTLNAGGEEGILTVEYQEENTSDSKYYIKVGTKYYELTINPGDIELAEEATDVENLETEVTENIEITSSDTAETIIKIETVGNTITVTPVGKGTATITVTNGSITKQCVVTVEDNSPTAITINGADSVEVYSKITLTAELDKGTGDIEWTSSNPDVATIDDSGVVTGVCCATKTTTTITATYLPNNTIVATKEITVTPKYEGICYDCDEGVFDKCWVCNICGKIYIYEPSGIMVPADCELCWQEGLTGYYDNGNCSLHGSEHIVYVPDERSWCDGCLDYVNLYNFEYKLNFDCPKCDFGEVYDYGS